MEQFQIKKYFHSDRRVPVDLTTSVPLVAWTKNKNCSGSGYCATLYDGVAALNTTNDLLTMGATPELILLIATTGIWNRKSSSLLKQFFLNVYMCFLQLIRLLGR